jgi:hypothetical protein
MRAEVGKEKKYYGCDLKLGVGVKINVVSFYLRLLGVYLRKHLSHQKRMQHESLEFAATAGTVFWKTEME